MGYHYQYEFERIETEASGYSMLGGIGIVLDGHRELIRRRAQHGWRLSCCIPVKQRAEGYITEFDLVFEKAAEGEI